MFPSVDTVSLGECCPGDSFFFLFNWINRVTDFLVYGLFDLYPMSADAALLHFFVRTSLKIFILLVILIYVVGLFRASLDVEKVRRFLEGRKKIIGYFAGAAFGAVTPFCSCSAIPIFIAFTASGIPIGVTIAFLVTSPLINEVALVLLISEFGINFAIVYVVLGVVSGVLAGILFDFIKAEKYVLKEMLSQNEGDRNLLLSKEKIGITLKQRNRFAANEVKKIVTHVWFWALISIGISSFFHVYLTQDFVEKLMRIDFWSVPAAVLIGIPLYSSPAAIVPLAKTLMSKGFPQGTIIAFMMSATAASLPEFILLKQLLKPKLLIFLFVFFLFLFTLLGLTYNLIYYLF